MAFAKDNLAIFLGRKKLITFIPVRNKFKWRRLNAAFHFHGTRKTDVFVS